MKIFSALILTFSFALPAFSGDVTNAFVPEQDDAIEFAGQLDGNRLSCETSNTENSCSESFNKVHEIVSKQHSRTIPGYIDEVGKERRQLVFSIGTLTYNDKEVRIIFEYDETLDAVGVIWVDPAQN